jgi:4-hydroxybenzoate polyprenyltransferase
LKKIARWCDVVFLMRPTLFFPVWTFYLAGLHGGRGAGRAIEGFAHPLPSAAVMAALSALMGAVFILNQIQDAETDRVNRKLFLIANGDIPVRVAAVEAAVLSAAALVCAFWSDFLLGLGFLALFVLAGVLYNYPPARWKNHPVMGMVVNGAGGMIIYDLGWITAAGGRGLDAAVLAYGLGGVAVFLNTTLPDRKGDARTGKITFGVRYGVGTTAVWAMVFEIAAVAAAAAAREWILLVPSLLVLPLFVLAAARRTLADSLRATKFSVLALAAAVTWAYPLYLILIFGVFFFSRWYYRERFHFDYPNFRAS